VGVKLKSAMANVRYYRKSQGDAYYFNWTLKIANEFQKPFAPTHENMAGLDLHLDQEKQLLAANLRRAFSGI
ncbi:pyrimidine/purine nucleotide monophosphate nucleosidase domain-containing protein, partial [Bacillus subtilis]|uniref:pyrimidine/purine nucleotide monophosphate nucleosidase domain-containing protein n=1 Tax=Bacillus subtilis TaxID=1423 RepID=UPI00165A7173